MTSSPNKGHGLLGWWAVVTCFLLSGATGLLYEIVWSRYLHLFMGSSGHAHTVTLATFMAGLGLGNHVLGRWSDRWQRPLALYGWLELGVGLYGLLFPWILALWTAGYMAAGRALGPSSGWILPLKLGLGVAVMVLPATLMGGTLPALSRWMIQAREDIGQRLGVLYTINTAGAVLGCWLGGFVLLEAWGLEATMWATAAVNLLIGAGVLAVERLRAASHGAALLEEVEALDEGARVASEERPETPEVPGEAPEVSATPEAAAPGWGSLGRVQRAALVGTGLAGGLSMLYELVWIRMVGFVFGSSSQSFSIMLLTFIGGMALGGWLVAGWLRRERDALAGFAACELGIAAAVLMATPVYERFPLFFAWLRDSVARSDGGYLIFEGLEIGLLALLMLVPTVLMGAALPMAARAVVGSVEGLGGQVGRVFAVNTLGTMAGATLTGLWVLPALGLQATLFVGIGLSAALGVALLWAGRRRSWLPAAAGAAVAVAVALVWGGAWDPLLLTAGFFRNKAAPESFADFEASFADHRLLYSRDGQDTTVTVVEVDGERFLKVNGKTDASTLRDDMVTQVISGHLPMLLHPGAPTEALVIGLGSGVTAGAVLAHPGARVTVVELAEEVVEAARFFEPVNGAVLTDPRTTLHVGDAKDFLLLDGQARYDVVISEPSNPWISGVANLFTRDFFQAVDGRLSDDGVYVQWLQLYAFSDEAFARSLNTLRAVFPHVTVWRFTRADALLVASRRPLDGDLARLTRRLAVPAVAEALGPRGPLPVGTGLDLLAHQVLSDGLVSASFPGREPLNTDERPYLEFEAPRAMFRRDVPELLDRLDERRQPWGRERLLLGPWLAQRPLTVEGARALSALLERSGRDALAGGLADHAHFEALSRNPELELDKGELFKAGGARARYMAERLQRAGVPSAEACVQATTATAAELIEGTSAFMVTGAGLLVEWVTRCAQAHPAQAPSMRASLSALHLASGRLQPALDEARAGLEGQPPRDLQLDLLRLQGRAALELGLLDEARDAWSRLLALKPGDAEARRVLGP